MENITPAQVWTALLAIASAIVLLSNAAEKIAAAWRAAKAPNDEQNARLDALEEWRKSVDRKLDNDKVALDNIQEGNHAIYKALLALLDHGLDGNNVKQMQDAKGELQNHLINR